MFLAYILIFIFLEAQLQIPMEIFWQILSNNELYLYTVKELCRVLFPYTAVNEDELTLSEGDIVTILSKDAPDRGWWRGELHGRVGLFPDNFVQALPVQGT